MDLDAYDARSVAQVVWASDLANRPRSEHPRVGVAPLEPGLAPISGERLS